jgi:hypothetical protein
MWGRNEASLSMKNCKTPWENYTRHSVCDKQLLAKNNG